MPKYSCTILRAKPGRRMAKRYADLDAPPDDYSAGKVFQAREVEAGSFSAFVETIARLDVRECLIRGGVREDARADVEAGLFVRRLAYDRDDCPAAFEDRARNWIVLDADETDTPFDNDDPAASIAAWDRTLPAAIRNAPRAFFLSASAHRSPTVRGKLVVALRKPISNADAEAWAKAHGFDGSVCRTVQPNYFAAPVFAHGVVDPLAAWRVPTMFDGPRPFALKAPKASKGPKALATQADAARPTKRAKRVAKVIASRWLEGGRIETNAWLHLAGWCLSKGWSRDELAAMLARLDRDEPDAKKRHEHVHILNNARPIDGPGGARDWLGADFDRVDRILGHDAVLEAYASRRAARVADSGGDFKPAGEDDAGDVLLLLDTDKQGRPYGTHANVARVLEHAFTGRIRYEEHAGRIVCSDVPADWGHFPDGQWTDVHTTALVIYLNLMRINASSATVSEAVVHHAHADSYNVLTDWLRQAAIAWDGVPRVDTAMATYWGADDSPSTRAAGRVFLLSLAARGLEPGCMMHTCLVLIGAQGIRKSSSLKALAGAPWFSDSPLAIGALDGMQIIRGKWLWELAEYASVSARDRNTVKQFMSSAEDTFRASYGRFSETVARQTCFAITTNDAEILNDPTGARRFLPVTVVRPVDTTAIERDRDQLLGEAARRVLDGEQYHPTEAEDADMNPARLAATELCVRHDPWEEQIEAWIAERRPPVEGRIFASEAEASAWLDAPDAPPPPFTMGDLTDAATGAVPIPTDRLDKRAQMRLSAILRGLGYRRERARSDGGARRYVWTL